MNEAVKPEAVKAATIDFRCKRASIAGRGTAVDSGGETVGRVAGCMAEARGEVRVV